ncbi:hypothetical protein HK101_010761 [Irineochytrium annulatum]|nr:hypothetical protein HK101_010761 [Irineochytrium annulatum]
MQSTLPRSAASPTATLGALTDCDRLNALFPQDYVRLWGAAAVQPNLACCGWFGPGDLRYVACDGSGSVIALSLQGAGLAAGPLPDVSGLAALRYLNLANNSFTSVADTFYPLAGTLTALIISHNQQLFSNSVFPTSISRLTKLNILYFDDTGYTGPAPDLSPLTALTNCAVSNSSCISYANRQDFITAQPAACSTPPPDDLYNFGSLRPNASTLPACPNASPDITTATANFVASSSPIVLPAENISGAYEVPTSTIAVVSVAATLIIILLTSVLALLLRRPPSKPAVHAAPVAPVVVDPSDPPVKPQDAAGTGAAVGGNPGWRSRFLERAPTRYESRFANPADYMGAGGTSEATLEDAEHVAEDDDGLPRTWAGADGRGGSATVPFYMRGSGLPPLDRTGSRMPGGAL